MTKRSSFVARERAASSRPTQRPGPEGGVRDQNRRERIASLEKAGVALFLEHGVEGVTVDAVALAASMAKGNFYRYFDDLEALVAHLLAPLIKDASEAFDRCERDLARADTREALVEAYERLAGALAFAMLGAPEVVRLYLQESRGPASGARRPIAALARDIRARALHLTEIAHQHELLKPVPAAVSAHAVVGAVEELVFVGLSGTTDLGDPSGVAAALVELVLDGLRRR